jgi:hypothetical protein
MREKQSSVAHQQHKNSTYFPHAKLTFSRKAHAPKIKISLLSLIHLESQKRNKIPWKFRFSRPKFSWFPDFDRSSFNFSIQKRIKIIYYFFVLNKNFVEKNKKKKKNSHQFSLSKKKRIK